MRSANWIWRATEKHFFYIALRELQWASIWKISRWTLCQETNVVSLWITRNVKKKNGQNAQNSMLNALVHTANSHYWDKRLIYRRDSPKYRGCSVVLSNFFNLILIKYLNHLRPVVSIGTICQSQSHVFWEVTLCSLMSNYDIQRSMLPPFLLYTQLKTDCLAQRDRGSNGWHVYNFYQSTRLRITQGMNVCHHHYENFRIRMCAVCINIKGTKNLAFKVYSLVFVWFSP